MADASEVAGKIVQVLEDAWNNADGEAFGSQFADDADFVDIRGDYHSGRVPISAGHNAILETIYKGSTNRYELAHARSLDDKTILAQATAELNCPAGPLAGVNHSIFTLVLRDEGDGWKIAAFHNTMVPPTAGGRPN